MFSAAHRVLRGQRCCRCRSSCSFVALRGQKEVTVAVAVLRGPPCPPWTKVFFVFLRGPSWTKGSYSRRCARPPRALRGQRCCRCRSSCSFVALRGQKEVAVAVAVLRGPPCSPRPSSPVSSADKGVAVAVLRVPSWPFVEKRKLQSPLQFSAALRVLRGPRCCRCRSSRSFAALRGQKEVAVAVAVLRAPPCPPRTKVLPLPFSAALRVLRGPRCCRCRSSWPSAALRGQKEVAVAVAVLRGPPCPPRTKVLPLPFFAALRGPSWTNVLPLPFSAALRVLRGPRCCRCRSSRPFVALRG